MSRPIRMIVNADDFGFFDQVSRGILDAADRGVVTATGVMANGPALERWVDRLRALPATSIGVHLNATLGAPVTDAMRRWLSLHDEFPAKGALALAIQFGRLPVTTLLDEWRAQIRRCLDFGLRLSFVNSHEHVHMLPALYTKVRKLAEEFGIAHVRAPHPEWVPVTPGGWVRSSVFAMARALTPGSAEPVLIGITSSGKLDLDYCRTRFARLSRGVDYELMCHPGWNDAGAQRNPRLHAYHDWERELRALTSADFRQLLRDNDIALVSYEVLRK